MRSPGEGYADLDSNGLKDRGTGAKQEGQLQDLQQPAWLEEFFPQVFPVDTLEEKFVENKDRILFKNYQVKEKSSKAIKSSEDGVPP